MDMNLDELASVELDLWADGEGLEKIQRNLLGFQSFSCKNLNTWVNLY